MKTILFVLGSLGPHNRSGEPWNISWTPCFTTRRYLFNRETWTKITENYIFNWYLAVSPTQKTNKKLTFAELDMQEEHLTWKTNLSSIPWTDRRPFIRYMSSLRFNNSVPSHMLAWKCQEEISKISQASIHYRRKKKQYKLDSHCNYSWHVYLCNS